MTRRTLAGCWAKLAHAIGHIEILRVEINAAGAPDPTEIQLRRQYEPSEGAVIYRVGRMLEIPDHWSLIVGDAVHDLRSALDHLMWQLAIRNLGRMPTEAEARSIQFPEVRRLRDFNGNRFLRYTDSLDRDRLKPFQPYRRLGRGMRHPLPKLIRLSNIDKHRRINLLVNVPEGVSFINRPDGFRDCEPILMRMPDGRDVIQAQHWVPKRGPREGYMILRVPVRPTGPNPDVDWDVHLRGFITIGRMGPVVPMLEGMAAYVSAVLKAFDR